MFSARKFRPSPAVVIALTALVVAAAGTALAAPSRSTEHARSAKVKKPKHNDAKQDIALIKKYAAKLRGPKGLKGDAGAQGAQGAQGVKGDTGAQGAAGRSALTPLQSGETIRGIVGGRFQNGATPNSPMAAVASFPIPASVPLDNAHIEVAPSAHCTGSTSNVTAPAGYVCIYPDILVQANTVGGNTGVAGTTTLGFEMEWNATTANSQSSVRAEWAYTAP